MIKTQQNSDKVAMTLSFACVVHCFFMPSFLILTSGFLSFSIDNEVIHKLIVLIAVPVSIFAFYSGYKNHKTISHFSMGAIGLLLLILSVLLGAELLGEFGEKAITLCGSMFILYAHYMNYNLCQKLDCTCHET